MTPLARSVDLDTVLAGLHVVSIPMRVRFRGIQHREVALLHGPSGWGEFGPFLEYAPGEAVRWLSAAIEAAHGSWPAPVRDEIPCNATVPAVSPDRVGAVMARFDGCATAKVKVAEPGQDLAQDVDRVAAVREALGAAGRVRIDANGGWSVEQATHALARLQAYGIEYVEQPCASVEELAELRISLARSGIDIPVAADESIRKADDPLRVAALEAADLIVVKVAPLGGVAAALAIVEQCGLPAVVSSALDTSIGISAGVALAAALPDVPYACGLGTVNLLAGDVTDEPLVPVRGMLPVGRRVANPTLLQRFAASCERQEFWHHRVRDCWELSTR